MAGPPAWVLNGRVAAIVHVTGAGDQSFVVHEECRAARSPEGSQILHPSVTPQERVRLCSVAEYKEVAIGNAALKRIEGPIQGSAHHVAAAIRRSRCALASPKRAQIDDPAVSPCDRQQHGRSRQWIEFIVLGLSDYHPAVGNPICPTQPPALEARCLPPDHRAIGEHSKIGRHAARYW